MTLQVNSKDSSAESCVSHRQACLVSLLCLMTTGARWEVRRWISEHTGWGPWSIALLVGYLRAHSRGYYTAFLALVKTQTQPFPSSFGMWQVTKLGPGYLLADTFLLFNDWFLVSQDKLCQEEMVGTLGSENGFNLRLCDKSVWLSINQSWFLGFITHFLREKTQATTTTTKKQNQWSVCLWRGRSGIC